MKFRLSGQVTVSAYTTVEAESRAEAMEIAKDRNIVLGGVGRGASKEESWIVDEIDGEISGISIG